MSEELLLIIGGPGELTYGADLCTAGQSVNSSMRGDFPISRAYDNNSTTQALTSASSASGTYFGQNFGTPKHIRKVTIQQGFGGSATSYTVSGTDSIAVERSSDGSAWTEVVKLSPAQNQDVQEFLIPASAAYQYWRIKSLTAPSGEWAIRELEMMEAS